MVPLTESLYVSGHMHDKDHLLVEIGAGYYAEVWSLHQLALLNCARISEQMPWTTFLKGTIREQM